MELPVIIDFISWHWNWNENFYKKGPGESGFNYFIFSDGSYKKENTYEAYDPFIVNNIWIIHGHETIAAYDRHGNKLNKNYFR